MGESVDSAPQSINTKDRKILMTRRKFLSLAGLSALASVLAACGVQLTALEPTPKPTEPPTPTDVPVYLPKQERLSQEKLPADTLTAKELWNTYHTRVWSNGNVNLFLRQKIATEPIFKRLKEKQVDSLDIILVTDRISIQGLTEEQRKNLPPEFFTALARFNTENGLIASGVLLSVQNKRYAVIRNYDVSLAESHPTEKDVTTSSLGSTLRHELKHIMDISHTVLGYRMMDDLQKADEAWQKNGDDSLYCYLLETKQGLIYT